MAWGREVHTAPCGETKRTFEFPQPHLSWEWTTQAAARAQLGPEGPSRPAEAYIFLLHLDLRGVSKEIKRAHLHPRWTQGVQGITP